MHLCASSVFQIAFQKIWIYIRIRRLYNNRSNQTNFLKIENKKMNIRAIYNYSIYQQRTVTVTEINVKLENNETTTDVKKVSRCSNDFIKRKDLIEAQKRSRRADDRGRLREIKRPGESSSRKARKLLSRLDPSARRMRTRGEEKSE